MTPQKHKKSNFGAKLRKFYRDVQQNRILSEAKNKQYTQRKVSRTKRRESALRKSNIKKIVRGY
jgi:ribosomal protein S21